MRPLMTVPVDWRRPDDQRSWPIWWSDRSDFGQVHPRPAPQEVAEFYDIDAYYTHAERVQIDSVAEARQVGVVGRVLASIAYRFENGAEPTAAWWRCIIPDTARQGLEIGCGDGSQMMTYGRCLERVCGVEPDPRAVSVARSRGLNVHFGTAEDLPEEIKDRAYDLIVLVHVLEHTIDPVLSLINARALLAKDGILSIEVPNNACEGARSMAEGWRWLDAPRHLNFFTPDSLQRCAEAAGLKVDAVLYRGYVRQFASDWIMDEARIAAGLQGRAMTPHDVRAQLKHSVKLLAKTACAPPERKYDSVRILCSRA